MARDIEVSLLSHNLDGTPKFLAQLTQRGHKIDSMADLERLYANTKFSTPSESLLTLPHSTIKRMNYITIAITGLSTKAVSQLRTHATRLTFLSTSTQYSSYENRVNNYYIPDGLNDTQVGYMTEAYDTIQQIYNQMLNVLEDKDKASYLLPQGLRKALVISGNLDAWEYLMRTRLCRRNTEEVQLVCRKIYLKLKDNCPEVFVSRMLPSCVNGKCEEGKFSCGKPIRKEEFENE